MNIVNQMQVFNDLHRQLMSGEIEAIEYGNAYTPGGIFAFLRVRALPTPGGGLKLAVKELYLGREGSGVYFELSDRAGLEAHLISRLEYIHRPRRFPRISSDSPAPAVSFFGIARLDSLLGLEEVLFARTGIAFGNSHNTQAS